MRVYTLPDPSLLVVQIALENFSNNSEIETDNRRKDKAARRANQTYVQLHTYRCTQYSSTRFHSLARRTLQYNERHECSGQSHELIIRTSANRDLMLPNRRRKLLCTACRSRRIQLLLSLQTSSLVPGSNYCHYCCFSQHLARGG